jgi:hypothetical protein
MNAPEIDRQLADEVARRKALAIQHNRHVNSSLGASLIAGVLVGLGTWFMQKPMNRDEIMFGGVLGLGLATFFIGGMLSRMLMPNPEMKCPKCGHDWRGSDPTDDWLTWNCCPKCGLKMSDERTEHAT